MGTRSLTIIKDEADKEMMVMYRQFDGYIDGHGAELFHFLKGMVVVNGLSDPEPEKVANGLGCLAAQIVAHFKKSAGGFYLHTPTNEEYNLWQEYTYTVYLKDGKICLKANSKYRGDLFDGFVDEVTQEQFENCENEEEDE